MRKNKTTEKHNAKQVWSNNLFLIKMCFQASPAYVIFMTLDSVRNSLSVFLEHTYGIGYILEAAEFHYPFKKVAIFVLGLAVLVTLEMIFSAWVMNFVGAKNLPKMRQKVKLVLYKKASEADLKCYDNPEYYNQLTLVLSEADKQIDRCVTFLRNTFSGIAVFVTTGLYFLYKDPFSVLFAVISFATSFCFNQIYNRLTFQLRVAKNPYERKRDYAKRVFYMQEYAKELRLNPKTAEIIYRDFEKCNDEIYNVEKRYMKKRFCVSFLRRYIANDFMSDVVYISYLVFQAAVLGRLSYSAVAILYNSCGRLKRGLSLFTDVYPYACETSLYVQKIRDFLDMKPELVSEKKLPVSNGAKKIEIRNVCFGYGTPNKKKSQILNDISFTIQPGEKIAIVGYNGAGKTTLMKLIMRLYDPESGQITADDKNIRDYDLQEYRKSIGTALQDFKIFAGTIKENVLMDATETEEQDENVKLALTRGGLAERLTTLPNGINTMITTEFDNEGVNLSGGESQKLAISRAFYKDAGLIILDEPSAALDPIAEYQLNRAMLKMTEHKTVIFISHRLSTTRLANRIILIENGKIAETGTHESLLKAQGKYAQMWNAQAGQYLS